MSKRRQFLALMGAAMAGSVMLAGCLGNPPEPGGGSAGGSPPSIAAAPSNLETKTISLGFIPILEAAPLVVGVEKGFFAKHGLEVNLTKQASWPSARDNLVLGRFASTNCYQEQLSLGNTAVSSPRAGA